MLLQQCETKTVAILAVETQCGFQPFFTYASANFTVGMDGWSIHPYSDCFWKTNYVNLNGNAFAWEHNATGGDCIRQNLTVHTTHLDLIAEFEELQLSDFDFALKAHPELDVMEMEQLNILNDLVGRLHGIETKTLSDIVVTEEQNNSIGTMFSWFDTLKIMGICTIGFIIFRIVIRLFIACNIVPKLAKVCHPLRKPKNQHEINGENPLVTLQEMLGQNLKTIYTPAINEPTFLRTNAPLPLQNYLLSFPVFQHEIKYAKTAKWKHIPRKDKSINTIAR
jgi:hypothetical protein